LRYEGDTLFLPAAFHGEKMFLLMNRYAQQRFRVRRAVQAAASAATFAVTYGFSRQMRCFILAITCCRPRADAPRDITLRYARLLFAIEAMLKTRQSPSSRLRAAQRYATSCCAFTAACAARR